MIMLPILPKQDGFVQGSLVCKQVIKQQKLIKHDRKKRKVKSIK